MQDAVSICQWLVLIAAVIYALRTTVASLVFLRRAVPWAEALAVSVWLLMLELPMFYSVGLRQAPVNWLDGIAMGLYLTGSSIHSLAEFQRYRFKADPANQGKLYTNGLFGLVRHPNCLGDTLLFTGWSLLTGNAWILILPTLMLSSFVFSHIPRMTRYLASRYPQQFPDYAKQTARLIPWVY